MRRRTSGDRPAFTGKERDGDLPFHLQLLFEYSYYYLAGIYIFADNKIKNKKQIGE